MTSKIAQAGDVNFKSIRLMNGAGIDIDISYLVVNIDLYESLHRPFMSGSILMADSKALMSRFPIIGEELLHLSFETPTTGKTIDKTFFIDRLEIRYGENNKSAYILHFTSVNMMKDMNLKHSSAYAGYASDIVPEIFKQTLTEAWPSTEDEIYVEKTANKIKFIANFWTPFRCINYCADNSISANDAMQSPSFIFYEDNKKYNFRSVGELVTVGSRTSSGRKFFFDSVNGRKDAATGTAYALIAQYETVLNLKVVGGFDYFCRHAAGAWANRVVEFDLMRKAINTRLYNYWYDFENSGHLGGHPAVSNQVEYDDTNANVESSTIFTHAHEGIMNDQRGVIAAKRNGLLANLDYMSLVLEIHGRTDLVVGDVIDLRLQNFADVMGAASECYASLASGLDELWSGNYIITEMQHRLSTNRHKIVMKVSKDGVNKKITFPEKVQ